MRPIRPILALAATLLAGVAPAQDASRPPSPGNVEAVATDAGTAVSWSAVPAALSYRLYDGRAGVELVETLETSVVDASGASSYFVTACDARNLCSVPSGRVTTTPGFSEEPDPATDPLVPRAVRFAPAADGSATIAFAPVVGALGYLLHVDGTYRTYTATATRFAVEDFDAAARYQVSAFLGEGAPLPYPPKSRPATEDTGAGEDELEAALARIAVLEVRATEDARTIATLRARVAELEGGTTDASAGGE